MGRAQPRSVPAAFALPDMHLGSGRVLLSNTLTLFNHTSAPQIFIPFRRTDGMRVFNLPDSIAVPAFGSISVAVKFLPLVPALQPAEGEWCVWFAGSSGDTIKASFRISADPLRQVLLQQEGDRLPLPAGPATYALVFRISNKGNTRERVALKLSPGRFRLKGRPVVCLLAPFSDTLLHVALEEDRYAFQYDEAASLIFSLTDSASRLLSSLSVSPPGRNGGLRRAWEADRQQDNFLLLQAAGIGTTYRFNEALLACNSYGRGQGLILMADVVDQLADRRKIIRNSYIGYRAGSLETRLGTINRFDLLPLSGQGAQVQWGSKGSQAGIAYLHTANTYLYNDGLVSSQGLKSLSAFAQAPLARGLSAGIKLLGQWEPGTTVSNVMGAGNMLWSRSEAGTIGVEGVYSRTVAQNGLVRYGWMGTLQAHRQKGRWVLDLGDVYASPYYSGLLQHTLQMQHTLSYALTGDGQHRVAVYQNNLNTGNRYDYFSGTASRYSYRTDQYGVSYQWQRAWWQATLTPYAARQQYNPGTDYHFESLRTALMLHAGWHRWSGDMSLDWSWRQKDGGTTAAVRPLRLQSNLRYGCLMLQVFCQKGAYYVTDLQMQSLSGKQTEFLNLGPSVHLTALQRRLDWQAGYFIQFDQRYDKPLHNVQSSVVLHLLPCADFRADWFYYNNSMSRNSDLRLGLQVYFGKVASWRQRSRRLLLFDDRNQNGRWDPEEQRLGNTVVQYNNRLMRSNSDGFIRWNGTAVPGGLTLPASNGYALLPDTAFSRSGTTIAVPLYRMGFLKASVSVIIPRYLNTPVSAEGVVLQLVAASGKTYSASIRTGGQLEIYAPAGSYTLRVAPEAAAVFAFRKDPEIKVTAGEEQSLGLELVYRLAREVEVKKFGVPAQD